MRRSILSSLHTTYQDGCLMYSHICAHIVIYLFMCQAYVYEYLRLPCFRDSALTPPCDIVITVLNARSRGTDAPLDSSTFLLSLPSFVLPGLCAPIPSLHKTDQLEVRPLTWWQQ